MELHQERFCVTITTGVFRSEIFTQITEMLMFDIGPLNVLASRCRAELRDLYPNPHPDFVISDLKDRVYFYYDIE